jgi:amidase
LRTSTLAGVSAAVLPALAASRENTTCPPSIPEIKPFELDEITIADLQAGMASGKFTARSITEKYLGRIEEIDKQGPALNSVIEINPDALAIADALDQERKANHLRSPMHGIPVLIKDNIDTADRMQTTAGSLALLGSQRVGKYSLQPFQQRMERARRPDHEPLRA